MSDCARLVLMMLALDGMLVACAAGWIARAVREMRRRVAAVEEAQRRAGEATGRAELASAEAESRRARRSGRLV